MNKNRPSICVGTAVLFIINTTPFAWQINHCNPNKKESSDTVNNGRTSAVQYASRNLARGGNTLGHVQTLLGRFFHDASIVTIQLLQLKQLVVTNEYTLHLRFITQSTLGNTS